MSQRDKGKMGAAWASSLSMAHIVLGELRPLAGHCSTCHTHARWREPVSMESGHPVTHLSAAAERALLQEATCMHHVAYLRCCPCYHKDRAKRDAELLLHHYTKVAI